MKSTEQLKEFRGLDQKELEEKVHALEEENMKLGFRHASGQFDNTAQFKTLRRKIARVKTVINEQRSA